MLDQASRALRDTLGRFATGIGILTARDRDGAPVGLTINSFNSVSLDPPLVVFSLGLGLRRLSVFQQAQWYGISLLRADQESVSTAFATPGVDAFAATTWRDGAHGVPLIEPALAHFELAPYAEHDGGDHRLFLARVVRHAWFVGEPLVYFAGRYRRLLPETAA